MASAQEAANNAVTNESEARAVSGTSTSATTVTSGSHDGEHTSSHSVKPSKKLMCILVPALYQASLTVLVACPDMSTLLNHTHSKKVVFQKY